MFCDQRRAVSYNRGMETTSPTSRMTPPRVVDAFHLELRLKILEIAATLDRYDRATAAHGRPTADPRWSRCLEALAVLTDESASANRAESIALLFSNPGA